MIRRFGAAFLALGVVAAAWLIGSTALWVLGLGLVLAYGAARLWATLVERSLSVERAPLASAPVEGGVLRLEARVRGHRWLASRIEWRDRIGMFGEQAAPVTRGGRVRLVLEAAPRGRYVLGPGRLLADDPLGLIRVAVPAPTEASVLVRPRVPELGTLFTDQGTWSDGGRRANARRPSGLEPHGVRDYVEGEPLRAVHWPTSARRGELMVRELEDAPRDSVAVVLDVDAASQAGPRGDSSLDEAVRAAAGLLRAYAARSRRALLVIGARSPLTMRVHALGRDWQEALDALAAVEPVEGAPLAQLLTARAATASVPELVVVTARPAIVANPLVARATSGRTSALVFVDAATYAGRSPSDPSATLTRLAGAGVQIAVVRRGDSLPAALGTLRTKVTAASG